MIILIPFHLLKLRKLLEKSRSPENLIALQKLIQDDILGSIDTNIECGNISMSDGYRLVDLTKALYDEIYSHYEGMEELNRMTDESLILKYDIMEKAMEEQNAILKEQENIINDLNKALQANLLEIERLKAEIEKLKQR